MCQRDEKIINNPKPTAEIFSDRAKKAKFYLTAFPALALGPRQQWFACISSCESHRRNEPDSLL